MTLRKSKEVGKNSEGDQKKKKRTFYLEILLTIDIGLSSDSLLTLHPVYGVTLCQPDIVTCWATHSGSSALSGKPLVLSPSLALASHPPSPRSEPLLMLTAHPRAIIHPAHGKLWRK